MLTAAEARALLIYDPDTGLMKWRVSPRIGIPAGTAAGSPDNDGYIIIKYRGKSYKSHRLIWLMMTGQWPPKFIDHRDGNPANNRWGNIRLADRHQNNWNKKNRCDNTSGRKGASFNKCGGKPWRSQISVAGKTFHLGLFETSDEAHAAYVAAAEHYFGAFACAG